MILILKIFIGVLLALEVTKFLNGKRKMTRDQFVRAKRTIKRKLKKIFKK